MKYILSFFTCFFLITVASLGQTINFNLADSPSVPYYFYTYNGLKIDTLSVGTTDMKGNGKIEIPKKYKDVSLMGVLYPNVKDGKPLELIVNGESFTVNRLSDGKVSLVGSIENDLFYNRQKEVMASEYDKTYVRSYLNMMSALMKMVQVLEAGNNANIQNVTMARIYALNNLDIDKMYYTKFWFFGIDYLFKLSIGEEGFARDVIRLLDNTKTDRVYNAFLEDIIMLTNQYGLDDAMMLIIGHVKEQGRVRFPQGLVYDAFEMHKVRKGVQAPELLGLKEKLSKTKNKHTLLVFHQPGCENCEIEMAKLVEKYETFRAKGIEVVSISGALNDEAFKEETKSYPWKDKLYDKRGFAGENYQNYGIIGTPTFFLLNKEGVIIGRYAQLSDVEKNL